MEKVKLRFLSGGNKLSEDSALSNDARSIQQSPVACASHMTTNDQRPTMQRACDIVRSESLSAPHSLENVPPAAPARREVPPKQIPQREYSTSSLQPRLIRVQVSDCAQFHEESLRQLHVKPSSQRLEDQLTILKLAFTTAIFSYLFIHRLPPFPAIHTHSISHSQIQIHASSLEYTPTSTQSSSLVVFDAHFTLTRRAI
jgi:hypothetical protein